MIPVQLTKFGERLTLQQYEERVLSLHMGKSPAEQVATEIKVRRQELDLKVDFHLGVAFPSDRRQALWEQQCRLDKRWLLSLVGALLAHPTDPLFGMFRDQIRGFARVLNRAELATFFDLTEDELAKLL